MKLQRFSSLVHKWAGITIGIQVMLWIVSGLYMVWYPIEEIRGSHLVRETVQEPLNASSHSLDVLQVLLSDLEEEAVSYSATSLHGAPVYRVETSGGDLTYDATTGRQLSPFGPDWASETVARLYAGDGEILTAELSSDNFPDLKSGQNWLKVTFDDSEGTRIYLDPDSGQLRAVRTDRWRIFDFMWMLHIMDYDDRTNFNTPHLIFFSLASVIFSITGFILVFYRFNRRDFRWVLKKR